MPVFADDTYLVEIRLALTKWRIKDLVASICHEGQIDEFREEHPHVTLLGPFRLAEGTSEQDILADIGTIASRFPLIPFLIDGWEKREGLHGSVLAFPVRPSGDLQALTGAIGEALSPRVESLNAWDSQPEKKWYHVTIANRLDARTCARAYALLEGGVIPEEDETAGKPGILGALTGLFSKKRKEVAARRAFHPPLLDETGLRITVMKGEHILAEYDLLEHRWLSTGHDHSGISWQRTLGHYRSLAGLELHDPLPAHLPETFVISDLHLGHANIIRYCSRPFIASDVREMDHVLLKNWNYTVAPDDQVFHLGDLRYGRDALPSHDYRKRLRGRISFITGNHDDSSLPGTDHAELSCAGYTFLLIHDPADTPQDFAGWIIHGHHHNNNLRQFPFISMERRTINVSAEVIGYRPVSIREITDILSRKERWGDSAPVLLRNPPVFPTPGTHGLLRGTT